MVPGNCADALLVDWVVADWVGVVKMSQSSGCWLLLDWVVADWVVVE